MKRIIEKRSNMGCVSPPEGSTHLIPLSVCLSILCLFCISIHPQLGPVRFVITRSERKLAPIMYLKLLEKQEQTKPKTSKWREIIKIRAEINEIKTKQTTQRINETKSWFFEKINKIDKPLGNMTKWKRETVQINKIRDEKGDIPQIPMKSTESLESTLKIYIQVNLKI
jgi:hypothetical protein